MNFSPIVRKFLVLRRLGLAKRQLSDGHHVAPPKGYEHLVRLNMNDGYPVPKQTYAEAYARRQAKNNKFLFLSAVLLLSAIATVSVAGTFSFLEPPPRKVLDWGQDAQ